MSKLSEEEMRDQVERTLALFFTGNRMPHMSGDPRERVPPTKRRDLADATDNIIALLQPALERARREVDQAREMRKRLDKRIHCQRKANRDNWEIVEQRRKWLGSQASQRAWMLMRNRALAAEAKLAVLKAPNELADEIERRRLKFADPADGYYEMLSDEEHEQIAAAIRKG